MRRSLLLLLLVLAASSTASAQPASDQSDPAKAGGYAKPVDFRLHAPPRQALL
jgi:hypothetical protein